MKVAIHAEPIGEGKDKEDAADKKLDAWEIQNHVDTLHRAEKIKGDEKLMKQLHPHIKAHQEAAHKIKSIKQLKEVARKKLSEQEEA